MSIRGFNMAHDPFTVFPRTKKNGQKVFYVRFRDPESGRRMTARSTNLPSKTAAKAWAAEQWKQGVFQGKASMSFAQYAEDSWVWGKCPYIEKKRARGQQIGRAYADNNRQHLVGYSRTLERRSYPRSAATVWKLSRCPSSSRLRRANASRQKPPITY